MKEVMIINVVSAIASSIAIAVACHVTKSAWPLLAYVIVPQWEFHKGGNENE